MKKNGLIGILVALALVLSACGGSAPSEADRFDNKMEYSMEETWAPGAAPMATEPADAGVTSSGTLSTYSDPNAKLIRRVYLDAQTREYDAVMAGIEAKIAELGGYVENRDAYNGNEYYGRQGRYCDMTVRIPADRLDQFVTHVNENCNVTNTSETVENITLEYTDTAARVAALETEQARLLELLEQAMNLTEILEIEARLSDVRYELTSYASQLRVMDNMVTYATIRLNISEVEKLTPVEEPTVWERISNGFRDSLEDVTEGMVDAFVWVTANSPRLVLLAVLALLGFGAGKLVFHGRKHKVKKNKAEQKPEQAE